MIYAIVGAKIPYEDGKEFFLERPLRAIMRTFALLILALTLYAPTAIAIPVPEGFKQERVEVNGIHLNVYRGGHGEPLLLLHGFAQSALMWAPVMKEFQKRFDMIVPDLRGAGLSDVPDSGYEKVTMAVDMAALLDHYKIAKARVVGHDIGLMVAYALAASFPDRVERLVVMDAFVPGIGTGEAIYNSPDIWHFRFHGPYAEQLVKGRERIFFDSLWEGFSANPHTFPEEHKKYYLAQYTRAGHMHAGFAWFKALPQDALDNQKLARSPLPMPVLALGGEKSMGPSLALTMKGVSRSVKERVVHDCGHWMLEECPAETIAALADFL